MLIPGRGKRPWLKWAAVLFILVILRPANAQTTILVAAAADLQPVLPAILQQFSQKTGIRAEATYKASAMLTTQIQNGAPFDIFLAANLGYPSRVIKAGLADSTEPIPYAAGTLVLWTRNDSSLPAPSLDLLRNSSALRRLAIANPDRAPYGNAAVAALTSLGLYDTLKPKLATAENISQAAQFVYSHNADAGLISLTSALTPEMKAAGRYFVIPRNLYPPLQQGAVVMRNARHRAAAHRLLDFLLSTPVQAQLAKGGLAPVH